MHTTVSPGEAFKNTKRKRISDVIDIQTIRCWLKYDPLTGELIWLKNNKSVKAGHRAGCLGSDGHRVIKIRQTIFYEHRVIWFMVKDEEPPDYVDHRNGVRSDNRWENLRVSTPSQNCQNSDWGPLRGIRELAKGCDVMITTAEGVTHFKVDTLSEALALRRNLEIQHYREFACTLR